MAKRQRRNPRGTVETLALVALVGGGAYLGWQYLQQQKARAGVPVSGPPPAFGPPPGTYYPGYGRVGGLGY